MRAVRILCWVSGEHLLVPAESAPKAKVRTRTIRTINKLYRAVPEIAAAARMPVFERCLLDSL